MGDLLILDNRENIYFLTFLRDTFGICQETSLAL